jgi:hypothetical protein
MGDESGPAATGTFVFDLDEIISEVRREAKERKADSPDSLGDTTGIQRGSECALNPHK